MHFQIESISKIKTGSTNPQGKAAIADCNAASSRTVETTIVGSHKTVLVGEEAAGGKQSASDSPNTVPRMLVKYLGTCYPNKNSKEVSCLPKKTALRLEVRESSPLLDVMGFGFSRCCGTWYAIMSVARGDGL